MLLEFSGQQLDSYFGLTDDMAQDAHLYAHVPGLISIVWNRGDEVVPFRVDGVGIELEPGSMATTTYLQNLEFLRADLPLTGFIFNREFYCIRDHDHEVSCNGLLFFGSQETPVIHLDEEELRKFELLYEVFVDEFKTRDNIQGEMLIMLLKRLIIKTTRLMKVQHVPEQVSPSQIDTIREFNVLLNMHYREKHKVSDYAEMLFKSPKTLSNLFAKYNEKSPLQLIHERIVLEARRMLIYTDKSVKQIAVDLGYPEVASFHKLFKKVTGMSPQQFKTHMLEQQKEI